MLRALLAALVLSLATKAVAAENGNPVVVMETNKGTVVIELWQDQAPITVEKLS